MGFDSAFQGLIVLVMEFNKRVIIHSFISIRP